MDKRKVKKRIEYIATLKAMSIVTRRITYKLNRGESLSKEELAILRISPRLIKMCREAVDKELEDDG